MKKSDLYRKWAEVLDMCDGTKVHPYLCWNRKGFKHGVPCKPEFTEDPDSYIFAVAVMEDRPVFVGDKVYDKYGYAQIVVDAGQLGKVIWKDYTWNPPKNTFNLNGEELPCPTKISDNPLSSAFLIGGQAYHFSNWDDCLKVQVAIHKLLQDASK